MIGWRGGGVTVVEPMQVSFRRLTQDIKDAHEDMKESYRLSNSPADRGAGTDCHANYDYSILL
jgi:hypothetical protein